MIIRHKWYIAILAGLAVILLTSLVACNGGEEATPTPTPAVTATPTVAPTATPTVAPTATPTVAPTATPTVAPTATPTVAPTPGGPPLIPADHFDAGCSGCHATGAVGAPQWPVYHEGYTEYTLEGCAVCHEQAGP